MLPADALQLSNNLLESWREIWKYSEKKKYLFHLHLQHMKSAVAVDSMLSLFPLTTIAPNALIRDQAQW